MSDPNVIVSLTLRFDPPLERAPLEMLQADYGLSVVLDEGRRVRLDPADPRSAGFALVLDGLSKQRLPVYIELDPVKDTISRLFIPHVARVISLQERDGLLDVELDTSHARHVLKLDDPDAPELARQLRDAMMEKRALVIAEDDAHQILAITAFTPNPEGPSLPFPPSPLPPLEYPWLPPWLRELLLPIWKWMCWPWWWFRCLSMTRAQQVFDAMAATTCNPQTVPPPCIPFLYPDDGCWARAHEMCRLMIDMGLTPRKVWIDHSPGVWLHVNTRNNPICFVEWGWHVAPTLCVRGPGFFQTQRMVIDPSLFTAPVTSATWKSVQGDPAATLTETNWDQFWHGGGTDPGYVWTNNILAQYRLSLQNRSIQFGPPPYANCP